MNSQFCNKSASPAPRPLPAMCNAFLTANGGTQNATVQDVHQTVDSYAAYAQANCPLHRPDLRDARRALQQGQEGRVLRPGRPIPSWPRSARRESLTLPDVEDEQVHLSPRPQLRAERGPFCSSRTYSTGYKSAGYNSGAGSPSLTIPVPATTRRLRFRPERRVFDRETVGEFRTGRQDQLARPQADR